MGELSYFDQEFETATREHLQWRQWERGMAHLERAGESVFYRRKFAGAGVDLSEVHTPEDFRRLPVTRKSELVEDARELPPYGRKVRVPREEIVGVVQTSGTSEKGKETHVFTERDRERIVHIEAVGFRWAGVSTGSVVALTLPITMGAAGMWWHLGLQRLGANTLRLGLQSAEEKLEYMAEFQANVLVATPAYVARLEAAAMEIGMDLAAALPSLHSIVMAGESKSASWAEDRETMWQATVYEQWGCSAGAVAWCCEGGMRDGDKLRMMHGLPHWTYLEVIDPETGKHVEDGEYGEVVITPLEVYGAPLIRFATGDRARFRSWNNCSCGRPFDGIEAGSVSRYDDMVKVKGINVWPSSVALVIDAHHEVEDHAVTISTDGRGREHIEARIEFKEPVPRARRDEVMAELRDELRASTGLSFDILEAEQALGESTLEAQSGKVQRWQDIRDGGGADSCRDDVVIGRLMRRRPDDQRRWLP